MIQVLNEWKGVAEVFGVSWNTVRDWHYTILKIPFEKSVDSLQGRNYISPALLLRWFEAACYLKPSLEKYRSVLYKNLDFAIIKKSKKDKIEKQQLADI